VGVSFLSIFNSSFITMFVVISVLNIIFILVAFIRRRIVFRHLILVKVNEDEKRNLFDMEDLGHKVLDKLDVKVSGSKNNDQIKSLEFDVKDELNRSVEKKVKGDNFFYAWDLVLISLLTIFSVIIILLPVFNGSILGTILGLFLILFLPGYAILAALFPEHGDLGGVERLALSFGLSIAFTTFIGLLLNFTPYGIRLNPILFSLSGLTFLLVIVAYLRRYFTVDDARFSVDFRGFFHSFITGFSGESKNVKVLSVVLIFSVLLAVCSAVYVLMEPKSSESYTEFYILGSGGLMSDYPTNMTSGENGSLFIGIVNHENKKVSYHLVVTNDGVVQLDELVTLNNKQSLEIPLNFTAGNPGRGEVNFMLYKLPDNNNVYRSLHLWLNINASNGSNGTIIG